MTTIKWKILFHVIIVLVLFGSGFFIGRSKIKTKEIITTEYIKGDTIRDTLYYPKPYKVTTPIDTMEIIKQCIKDGIYQELWPEKVITEYVEVTKEDTTKIVTDWASKRFYNETIFNNDSLGFCSINTEVQYNRMRVLGYKYTPVVKQITETKYVVKTFSPFIGIGYMDNPWDNIREPSILINGGLFIKEKYGLQLQLMHNMNYEKDYLSASFLYKF